MTFWEIVFIVAGFGLILIFSLLNEGEGLQNFRPIKAYTQLRKSIELSVEDGKRLHVSLGRGGLLGPQSAAAFAGLSLLREASRIASDSDQPPLATAGEGTLALLAQDTLRKNYQTLNIGEEFNNRQAQLSGLSALGYTAGIMSLLLDKQVSSSALVGSFGTEAALASAIKQGGNSFTLAGSDGLSSQAVLFATADEALIGEELFAAGAYLGAGAVHEASLRSQDILRVIISLSILVIALSKLIGVLF